MSVLKTAVGDARRLAQVLADRQRSRSHPPLLDAGGDARRTLLPRTRSPVVTAEDRVLFYFAGHGHRRDANDGPAGVSRAGDAIRWT